VPSIVQPDHAEAGGLGDTSEGAVDVPGSNWRPVRVVKT
jgi:hypothetical protein